MMVIEIDDENICPFCEENSELRPRAVKSVKPYGGGGRHITLKSEFAEIGDRILVINIEDKVERAFLHEVNKEEEKDLEEVVDEICIRCNFKWEGKRKNMPINCPYCGFAYWKRPSGFRPPTYKGIRYTIDEDKIHTGDKDKK